MSKYSLLQYLKKPKSWTELADLKAGTLSHFLTFIVAKLQKTEGGPFGKQFFFEKKSHCRKKTNGGPLVSPGIVCYAEKKRKTFLVQFARRNDSIWDHKIS